MLLFCYYDIVFNSTQQFMPGKRIPLLSLTLTSARRNQI